MWRSYVELTPGSGPQRTPRRDAAGPDVSSPGSSRLPRVRVQLPQTPPAQAVEDAPDAHGGQRRPSCALAPRPPGSAERAGTAAPAPDAEVSDEPRASMLQTAGCPDIVGTITLIVNRCRGLADRIDYLTMVRRRRRGEAAHVRG
ncbi:hypothetical protein EVAR_3458_1 [Eumeta japonica]|uniref:Uncharacterized protein n=1 Tax=Eumeta variegata TaxID=151549 RepID=A0A4C1SSD2_EUMVA|nr:hypothetical protein EVAR_3458_1 [Eumeta japonica]